LNDPDYYFKKAKPEQTSEGLVGFQAKQGRDLSIANRKGEIKNHHHRHDVELQKTKNHEEKQEAHTFGNTPLEPLLQRKEGYSNKEGIYQIHKDEGWDEYDHAFDSFAF
jgi:hypothetical protein